MPIDDALIDTKISALQTKIRALNSDRQDLEKIEKRLIQVRSIEIPPANRGDPPTKEIPMDDQTGIRFTTQRRQAIFDQVIIDADRALA